MPKQVKSVLNGGNTSLKEREGIFFKCEYENPTGSVKDRGIAYQVSCLAANGVRRAVISSSGNAAISAAHYCQQAGIDLVVFISHKINKEKLKILEKSSCKIIKTEKAVSSAVKYSQKQDVANLRQSTDPNATFGYESITFELDKQESNIDAIFIPVSSGTTLVGIASGFQKLGRLPAIHAVQTEAIHPIASLFDKDFTPRKTSLADALVARYTPRESQVVDIVKKSRGFAWIISDEEIIKRDGWLRSHGLNCSFEGGAVLAALWKAEDKGYHYKNPVCLLTGKRY